MTTEELIAFRNNPLYDVHLKLREWDDLAKLSDSILLAEIEKINPVEKLPVDKKVTVIAITIPKIPNKFPCLDVSGEDNPLKARINKTPETK